MSRRRTGRAEGRGWVVLPVVSTSALGGRTGMLEVQGGLVGSVRAGA